MPGEVHYADMSASIVRPKCLENLNEGLLLKSGWVKIAPIRNDAGFDIDFEQLPQLKYWIKTNGSN